MLTICDADPKGCNLLIIGISESRAQFRQIKVRFENLKSLIRLIVASEPAEIGDANADLKVFANSMPQGHALLHASAV